MVTAPVLDIVTSPDTATSVGLLESLPTIILPLSKFSSLEIVIAALLFISALTIDPLTILEESTESAPSIELVTLPVVRWTVSIEPAVICSESTALSANWAPVTASGPSAVVSTEFAA